MNDLATVLLPTYNGEKYIEQMLDSLYSQDYRPIEVIISDDASTDKTVSAIKHWLKGKNDETISFKLIRNRKNIGLSGNTSKAARYINGKYLFLADQDDIWRNNKISAQIEYLQRNDDCVMCFCDKDVINESGEIVCYSTNRCNCVNIKKRDYKAVLNSRIAYPANGMCLRTEHLDKIFPIPAQVCEHDVFITIMAAHFGKIGYLRKSLALYRIHKNNLSGPFPLETNKNLFKAGIIIRNSINRSNARLKSDPPIIKRELKRRFGENNVKFSKALYPDPVSNVYLKTIRYIFNNLSRWKLFLKEV